MLAATVLTFCFFALLVLFFDVQRQVQSQSTADTDKVLWTLAQTDVELLLLHDVMEDAYYGDGNLGDLRLRFDVLFSSLETFTVGKVFADLHADPEFQKDFLVLRDWVDRSVLLVDGPDEALRAALPRLIDEAFVIRPVVRKMGLAGIRVFSAASDTEREGVAKTLRALGLLAFSMIALLVGMVVVLMRLDRQNRRVAAEQKETLERLEAIIATALDAVIVINEQGRVVEFNAAATEVFGYSRQTAIGQDMGILIVPPQFRAAHAAGLARWSEGAKSHVVGQGRIRREAMRVDGTTFPVELSVASVSSGGHKLLVAFLRDLSSEVAAERALMAARDEALAGERTKAHLLAVMGHEMRTPLNGLIGMIDLMAETALDDRQDGYLAAMRTSGHILLQHVNDVLDIARLEAGSLPPREEVLNLDAMVQEVFATQRAAARTRGNRLILVPAPDAGGPRYLRGDPFQIRQMLMNLIGNAVKFTRDGTISVVLRPDPTGGRTVFEVADTGIGIAPEDQNRIFEDFVMLDPSLSRAAGGTGLGLGITRRIIQNLGGRIRLESTPGKGSTFAVDLPLAPVPATEAVHAATHNDEARPPPSQQKPLRVLVVEDNAINRLVVGEMLARLGHSAAEARDGEEGVRLARAEAFDAILMDISMPQMDGVTATQKIRAGRGKSRAAPVLALTAHAADHEIAELRAAGIVDILIKPVSLWDLAGALARVTGGEERAAPPAPQVTTEPFGAIDKKVFDEVKATLGPSRAGPTLAAFRSETTAGIEALAQDQSLEDLRKAAHRLAGSAALFGAAALAEALRAVEAACRDGKAGAARAAIAGLGPLWQETEAAIRAREGSKN